MDTDDLIVLDDRDKDISPQTVSKLVIDGDYILKKKKNAKGSRAWDQFRVVLNPLNDEELFGVACCCICKVCIYIYKAEKPSVCLSTFHLNSRC